MAVAIELLAFYRALFERSCDAINALASALNSHYNRRGFRMTGREGNTIQEPFRRSLGHAVQWFDVLQVEMEHRVESILTQSREHISAARTPTSHQSETQSDHLENHQPNSNSLSPQGTTELAQSSCASLLVQRCPACFGGNSHGRPLAEGGDIHVATDGNFHHRHRRSAGDCPAFYEPVYFLPKAQVDTVGQRIMKARRRQPKKHKALVPDEAIDQCETSYEAADGKKQKTAMDSFDDTGVMALICRHDIPLFFANIDTPGEQQKYSIALIEHLFSLLPSQANVVVLYDVGCVLARSLAQYDILDSKITSRVRFVTTAMHAYGHEWACQLIYNPRLSVGLGLSDGEGTERLWSRFIKLIGIERASSRQRRLWLIDRQAAAIGHDMRKELGSWLKRRMRKGVGEQGDAAQEVIASCGVPVAELQSQWKHQRAAQLSVRAHAPTRLKKELDSVLTLQADLDSSERALQAARATIEKDCVSEHALSVLDSMERSQNRLLDKIETLYASLNVQDKFPELEGVHLEFVRILLMARDLKINIRKRAIGSFFEWDKLDRAVGGKDKTLGTKLHQQTRKAIAKRQPALMAAIKKFNKYCEQLEEHYDPSYAIPLPTPLPTKLADLRSDQTLLQDVWISPSTGEIPLWLEDSSVREGIRALLKRDRCREEQCRLGIEADNMCRWFGLELCTVELALRQPQNSLFHPILQHRREAILELQEQWPTHLASTVRYTESSKRRRVAGCPVVCSLPSENIAEEDGENAEIEVSSSLVEPPDQILLGDVLIGGDIGDNDEEEEEEEVAPPVVDLQWNAPRSLKVDFIDVSSNALIISGNIVRRTRPPSDGFPRLTFEPKDIEILGSKEARLNDTCINGCAALLYSRFLSSHSDQIAIFSTHDLPRIRYNASDEVIWRNMSWTRYWEKSIWILPIHRPSPCGHWVLCTIDLTSQRLVLFDSLAEQRPWKNDTQDIIKLISRLFTIASRKCGIPRRHLGDWTANPVLLTPIQTNGIDCGLWVLAQLAALLRGYDITGLQEIDMAAFRQYLRLLVLRIPVVTL
ncbi:hypothetical protein HYDPIDRAFT_34233 [Hydnomerulius pinastri MD-312]|uniref:Ubiquitin-like protease family profile domain-containing protein n=1 Tax=Hydnomerulius pinastri MD-312 TaxID=994086 RepID=A0A0C9W7G9_9AGAM|nr:hypothetical protein HYDPIDRAFT_34233 [Hydnomerulius pinastri MD-312]